MPKPLTPRQQRFIHHYCESLNVAEAARRAGYSPRTADKKGAELMRREGVKAAIEGLLAEIRERSKLSAEMIERRLMAIAGLPGADALPEDSPPPRAADQIRALELLARRIPGFAAREEIDVSGGLRIVIGSAAGEGEETPWGPRGSPPARSGVPGDPTAG